MKISQIADRRDLPRMNQLILDNVAYHQLRPHLIMALVESDVYNIKSQFPEGLEFRGIKMVEPSAEVGHSIIHSTHGAKKRLKYDESNTFMVEFLFYLHGQKIGPIVTRLPYVKHGGELILDGKRSFVLPVVVDRGVNLKVDSCYIYLARANYIYARAHHDFRRNGGLVRDNVLTARLHQMSKSRRKTLQTSGNDKITAEPSIFIYLLMKLGLTEAAKQYFGLDMKVVTGNEEDVMAQYPESDYNVFSSAGLKPRSIQKEWWTIPNVHLVFDKKDRQLSQIFAANFFYLYDLFTVRTDAELMEDPDHWKQLGGILIFNYAELPGKLEQRINDHLERSIDTLLDNNSRNELLLDGIEVDDIYDLIAWLIRNEPTYFNRELSSMFNKRIQTARYTLAPITNAITTLSYELDLIKEGNVTPRKITDTLRRRLREGLIRNIKTKNGEVQSIQAATDNIFLNISRRMVHQAQTIKGGGGGGGKAMYAPENFAHASMLLYNNVTGLPKIRPHGREFFNPYLGLDKSWGLVHDERYDPTIESVARDLKRQ